MEVRSRLFSGWISFAGFGAVWLFHVKHCFLLYDVYSSRPCFTWNMGRGGWVVGDGFLKTVFLLIVVEELVFHMEHCFWILKLIRLPYVWLVSGSKEAQGGWHILFAFPPVDVDEFSHWLNKLLGCAFWGCFTWNPSWCGGFIEWVVWDGFGVCCLPLLVVMRVGVSPETIPLMDGIILITPPCFTWNVGVLRLVRCVYGKLGCVFLVAEWASVAGLFSPFQRRMCVMARTEGMVLDLTV